MTRSTVYLRETILDKLIRATLLDEVTELHHSKRWYEKHIAAEGDAEIGAGIPPGFPMHAKSDIAVDLPIRVPTALIHSRRRAAVRYPETPLPALAVHEEADKALPPRHLGARESSNPRPNRTTRDR